MCFFSGGTPLFLIFLLIDLFWLSEAFFSCFFLLSLSVFFFFFFSPVLLFEYFFIFFFDFHFIFVSSVCFLLKPLAYVFNSLWVLLYANLCRNLFTKTHTRGGGRAAAKLLVPRPYTHGGGWAGSRQTSCAPSLPFFVLFRRRWGQVRLWDVAKSRELGKLSFRGHNHPVRSLAISSDAKLLVSGGEDHKVR